MFGVGRISSFGIRSNNVRFQRNMEEKMQLAKTKLLIVEKKDNKITPRLNHKAIEEYVNSIKDGVIEFNCGVPATSLGRKVKIFQPSRHSMQSGLDQTYHWVLRFEPLPAWKHPLMGWTSGADPFYQIKTPTFNNLESALFFCLQQGFEYSIEEPISETFDTKSYADNFGLKRYKRKEDAATTPFADPFL